MVKKHLKRHVAANTWPIKRKGITFIVRPRPGGHPFSAGMSISTVLRLLNFCETNKEVKVALNSQDVFINGRKETEFKALIGFMDVLSIPEKKLYFRMSYDAKGKLNPVVIESKEAELVFCKINGITAIKGNKIQYNCMNGFNILSDDKAGKVNDVLLYDFKKKKIVNLLPLKEGASVFLIGGSLIGKMGVFNKTDKDSAIVTVDKEEHHTSLKYVFMVGDKKSELKIQ